MAKTTVPAAGQLKLCLLVLALLPACAIGVDPPRPNVALVVVDTLRADRLPFYGCPRNTAPFLNELAQRSLVFENAWSTSSWTLPATVSLVTSTHPFQHGVTNLIGLELEPGDEPVPVACIPDELETLAETMREAGYKTYGVVSNVLVGSAISFDRGFDRYVRLDDEDADAVNSIVKEWHEEMVDDEPYFLYLHYFDPHDPFHARDPWFHLDTPLDELGWPPGEYPGREGDAADLDWVLTHLDPMPEGFEGKTAADLSPAEVSEVMRWIRAAYDSEIGFVDARIREVYELLGLEDALVFLTSDHGEEFYEHGALTHGQNLYSETVRVPLLLQLPGDHARSGRVTTHSSILDVPPTLMGFLQQPQLPQYVGHDLLADPSERPIIGVLEDESGRHPSEADLFSIVHEGHRLITTKGDASELYDMLSDPGEFYDLAERLPNTADQLLGDLLRVEEEAVRFPRTTRVPEESPTEELLQHLKGIGYVGN